MSARAWPWWLVLAACGGADGSVGEACEEEGDCKDELVCVLDDPNDEEAGGYCDELVEDSGSPQAPERREALGGFFVSSGRDHGRSRAAGDGRRR